MDIEKDHDCKLDKWGEGHCDHPSHVERAVDIEPTEEEVEEFIKNN